MISIRKPSDLALVTMQVEVPDHVACGMAARRARVASGLSLREVARRMRLSAPFLSDLERGRRNWSERVMTSYRNAIWSKEAKR